MNHWRNFVCVILVAFTMSAACVCLAAGRNAANDADGFEGNRVSVLYHDQSVADVEEVIEVRTAKEALPWPEKSYLAVEGVPVTNMGAYWIQTEEGLSHYRVWIRNETAETMLVVIRYFPDPVNAPKGKDNMFTIPPNSQRTVSVNNAVPGYHFISTDTPTGEFAGEIRVREAEAAL